jgi:uncharacterized membrane protein
MPPREPEKDHIMTEPNPQSDPGSQPGPGTAPAKSGTAEPRTVDGGQGWNWIAQGWELFKKNPGIWIANTCILFIISLVIGLVPVVGSIATHLLLPVMIGGLMLGCRALERGEPFAVAHLFAGFKTNTSQLVMVGVFYVIGGLIIAGIVVLVVVLAGGGTLVAGALGGKGLAILAGGAFFVLALFAVLLASLLVIPLLMAMWFAPPLVVFGNLAALDAMKSSFSACLKNFAPFLVYGLLGIVLAVAASIPLMLGWLVLAPVLIASVYTGYRDIYQDA